jgi:hypothetical protein
MGRSGRIGISIMTIVAQSATIIDRTDQFNKQWCMYEHWMFDDTAQADVLLYVGLCRLSEVFHFHDARRNSEWMKRVQPSTTLTIRIAMTGTRKECTDQRGIYIHALPTRPICNMIGFDVVGTSPGIICNETNVRYASQVEACEALGLNQGRLSSHLAGKPGAVSLNGYTFRRALKGE